MKEDEKIKVVTDRGKLLFVNIKAPGKPNLSGKLEYSASIVLPATNSIFTQLDNLYKSKTNEKLENEHAWWKYCDENGTRSEAKTDYKLLRFKTNATFIGSDGKPVDTKINVFNSKVNKIDLGDTIIGNGSEGRIYGVAKYYIHNGKDGLSLFLKSIQLLNLEPYEDAPFEPGTDKDFQGIINEGVEDPEGVIFS